MAQGISVLEVFLVSCVVFPALQGTRDPAEIYIILFWGIAERNKQKKRNEGYKQRGRRAETNGSLLFLFLIISECMGRRFGVLVLLLLVFFVPVVPLSSVAAAAAVLLVFFTGRSVQVCFLFFFFFWFLVCSFFGNDFFL